MELTDSGGTLGRYILTQEKASKHVCLNAQSGSDAQDWWNALGFRGPIVEKGTHLCDLARYFGGDADPTSVVAHSVAVENDKAVQLGQIGFANPLHVGEKSPRLSQAFW
jgi:predicted dehydrogenase